MLRVNNNFWFLFRMNFFATLKTFQAASTPENRDHSHWVGRGKLFLVPRVSILLIEVRNVWSRPIWGIDGNLGGLQIVLGSGERARVEGFFNI